MVFFITLKETTDTVYPMKWRDGWEVAELCCAAKWDVNEILDANSKLVYVAFFQTKFTFLIYIMSFGYAADSTTIMYAVGSSW